MLDICSKERVHQGMLDVALIPCTMQSILTFTHKRLAQK